MNTVDLNCDLGESFGVYRVGADEEVVRWVTSVNVACGFHAGDPAVMRRTVGLAVEHGVAIGAHPGLADLEGFGRRAMAITPEEAYDLVVYQVGALLGFTLAAGATLRHVKPHGALYNMAAADDALADAIARAVRDVDPGLALFGLSGSRLVEAGERHGLRAVSEVFADRGYASDGTLVARGREGAFVTDTDAAVARAVRMVREARVRSVDGADVAVRADTICIHGDGPHAAEFARRLREGLEAAGIRVQAVGNGVRAIGDGI